MDLYYPASAVRIDPSNKPLRPEARETDVRKGVRLDHGVLAVAAAEMRPDQHVALAAHFGELEHHEFFENQGPGFEHITVLDSARGDRSSM